MTDSIFQFNGTDDYIIDDELKLTMNIAIKMNKPLFTAGFLEKMRKIILWRSLKKPMRSRSVLFRPNFALAEIPRFSFFAMIISFPPVLLAWAVTFWETKPFGTISILLKQRLLRIPRSWNFLLVCRCIHITFVSIPKGMVVLC